MSPSIHPRLMRLQTKNKNSKKLTKGNKKLTKVNSTETIDPASITGSLSQPTQIVQVPQVTTHRGRAYNRFKRDNYYHLDTNKPDKPERYKKSTMSKSHQKMSNCILLHFTKHSDAKYGVLGYDDKVHNINQNIPTEKVSFTFVGNPGEAKRGAYDVLNQGVPIRLFARLRSTESFSDIGVVKTIAHNPQNPDVGNNPTWLFETHFTRQSLSDSECDFLISVFD